MDTSLRHLPANRAIVLRNETCPYCGVALAKETRTKEHVVGRRFVPRGSLHQQWNLIVWACKPCNRRKAELEDDLSAISMHPDVTGAHVRDDVRLHAEAARKARSSISRRSGKAVGQSHEQFEVAIKPSPGIEFKFNFTSGPQADDARIFELVKMQLMAFFYWITIQKGEVNGRFWQGSFMPLSAVRQADWGNEQLMFFTNDTVNWDPRVHAITADGYFKISIKKHPEENVSVWSFAVEWNESYRIVGYFGDTEVLLALRSRIPVLRTELVPLQGSDFMRFRMEVPLAEDKDTLFALPGD